MKSNLAALRHKIRFGLVIAGLTLAVLAGVVFLTSPFRSHKGFSGRAVVSSVEIDAPAETVFVYLGNSGNASEWSVYVDHITPLNPEQVPDGKVGSERRCFTDPDGRKGTWDETILAVEQNRRRRLNIYNMRGMPLSSEAVLTEQLYEPLGPQKCRLSLTLFLDERIAGFTDRIKMFIAAFWVKNVFSANIANIKRICEDQYRREETGF